MLREIFASLGFGFEESGFVHAQKATEEVKHEAVEAGNAFELFGGAVKAAMGVELARKTWEFAESLEAQAAQIEHTAEATGLSTNALQEWFYAAKGAKVETGEFALALRKLSVAVAGGVDETGSQSKIFDKLKIATHGAHKELRPLAEILPEIAEHFKSMADGPAKAALAQEIFGRQGGKLIPLLNKGAEGIEALHDEFQKLGGGFSPEAIERAAEFNKQTVKLGASFDSLKSLIAVAVLPQVSRMVDKTVEGVVAFKQFAETTTGAEHAVGSLSTAIALTLATALAPYIGPGLKFVGIFLAVDDLQAFLEGKGSLIGDALNAAFGDGTADVVRAWVADAKDSLMGWGSASKLVIADVSVAFDTEIDEIGKSWDEMILGLQQSWNGFVSALHLPSDLKIDTLERKGKIAKDDQAIAGDEKKRSATQKAIADFNDRTTALSNPGGGFAPVGPVTAPVITQNFVEVKPNISITVPPGTSPAHASRLVREAAQGVTETERRAALQGVDKHG